MAELEPPDPHHLNAATGWLELGNPREARTELVRVSPAGQDHPEVLELHWRICAEEKDWSTALAIARRLVHAAPHEATGWIHQSYCLHELKRTEEAQKLLLGVAGQFSRISTVAYNLACYACQLGQLEEARHWLDRAIALVGKERIQAMALADPDLAPMRRQIEGLSS
jgi:predicted Zn-dependent protease